MLEVYRKEWKYLLSLPEASLLEGGLSRMLYPDSHNRERGYAVRSLYFDTLYDSDFEDKVQGYDKRQKVRLRIYDPQASVAKLELKEKVGNRQRKRSLSITRQEAEGMIRGEYRFLQERAEPVAKWLYAFMTSRSYRPRCIVEYNRHAYFHPNNDTRITLDTNLRATEASFALFQKDLVLYPVASPWEVTLEVKYNHFLFAYIRDFLEQAGRIRSSNSKYCRARMITQRGRY